MAKKKQSVANEYVCITNWEIWHGERIRRGEKIKVTSKELKNKGVKAKLNRGFKALAKVESEPIKLQDKVEIKEKDNGVN